MSLFTAVVAVLLASVLFVATLGYCYVRSRPDGVYKTNEDAMRYATPNQSHEPLVLHANDKEYFFWSIHSTHVLPFTHSLMKNTQVFYWGDR